MSTKHAYVFLCLPPALLARCGIYIYMNLLVAVFNLFIILAFLCNLETRTLHCHERFCSPKTNCTGFMSLWGFVAPISPNLESNEKPKIPKLMT
jgi:hypothetical protein